MEIWLIINGKRSGPYPDYEIRSRIEHGEMTSEEMVWHEGLPEWTSIGELELFRNSLEQQEQAPAIVPPPLPKDSSLGTSTSLKGRQRRRRRRRRNR